MVTVALIGHRHRKRGDDRLHEPHAQLPCAGELLALRFNGGQSPVDVGKPSVDFRL
jgi:hypothetical protein